LGGFAVTVGRPTKYRPEYVEQVYTLALQGMTDVQLAAAFGVSTVTLHAWQHSFPDFLNALKQGKEEFDDNTVVRSLLERATGYSYPDTHISTIKDEIVITPYTKRYPPDPTSMIFWLKNRQPAKWRDKVEQLHSGKIDIEVTFDGG